MRVLLVALGGALGSAARYLVTGLLHRRGVATFPAGTLVVNVAGCFLIGALMWLVEDRQLLGPETRVFLMIGVLGGFTTFSTFGYETFSLLRNGSFEMAVLNVLSSVILCLAAVVAGWMTARVIWR